MLCSALTLHLFFSVNLIHGLEESPTAFSNTVIASSLVSLAIVMGCSSYLSGMRMKSAASARQQEIDTISGALADMAAVSI